MTESPIPEERIAELGLELPPPFPPAGTYVPAVRTGDLLFLAGHIPIGADQQIVLGKLGDDLDLDAGRNAARLAALSAIATLKHEVGDLRRVSQIVSVRGVVNATPDFTGHTQVIDGASDVFVDVFGDRGKHARLAVGVSSLPVNLAVEIELVAEID
jgi:enamine deaminase RidA (YjgF/YER057c/UK114 family)